MPQDQNTTPGIFSARLAQSMADKGLTQVQLAGAVGVTQAAVSKWLNGTIPKGDQLLALSRVLDLRMEWLLTGEGWRTVEEMIAEAAHVIVDSGPPVRLGLRGFEVTDEQAEQIRREAEAADLDIVGRLHAAERRVKELEGKLSKIRKTLE